MGRFVKAFDYFFIVRPVLFYPIWTVYLAGFICARNTNDVFSKYWISLQSELTTLPFVVSFISISFLMGAVFIINQFTDVHSDKENNKLFSSFCPFFWKKICLIDFGRDFWSIFLLQHELSGWWSGVVTSCHATTDWNRPGPSILWMWGRLGEEETAPTWSHPCADPEPVPEPVLDSIWNPIWDPGQDRDRYRRFRGLGAGNSLQAGLGFGNCALFHHLISLVWKMCVLSWRLV